MLRAIQTSSQKNHTARELRHGGGGVRQLLLLRAHLYFAVRIWLCNPYKM